MKKVSAAKTILLGVLGVIFIACLIIMLVISSHTQEETFWENQQSMLALIAEKCQKELSGWVDLQISLLENMSSEYLSGRMTARQDIEAFLDRMVKENRQLVSAYILFGNSLSYFGGADPNQSHSYTDQTWYQEARMASEGIVFSEPYLEPASGQIVVSCLKPIKARSGSRALVGIDITVEELSYKVNTLSSSKHGNAYLVSRQGKIITDALDSSLMPNIQDNVATFTDAETIFNQVKVLENNEKYLSRGIQLSRMIDYDGQEKYEATISVPVTGWLLGVNIPLMDYEEAIQGVISNQMPIIMLAVFMSVISIAVAGIIIYESRQSRNLRRSVEMAQVASRTKSDFLSRMSHEMRTPMNAIIGMTKIADSTQDVEKLKHCLDTIDGASNHLLGIINDVLDMSKIEAGKFDLDMAPFNIETMLMRNCNLIMDKTEAKRQRLNVIFAPNTRVHFIGDELRLSQVVTNLLSNAVKFTPEGGAITLRVSEMERGEDYSIMRFSVQDTGIGVTQEQASRLFQPFEQADGSISRKFGGTGLGLVISKTIVEKMDGRIWVESEMGHGANFIFQVKLSRAKDYYETIIFDGITPSELRLLLVDGDVFARTYVRSITDSFGIQTDEADSNKRAVYMVETAKEVNRPYDVIFFDYDMAENGGMETLRQINSLIDKNTVVIMTTFMDWHKIEREASELGVTRYLSKPLFPSSLLDSIVDVVGRTVKKIDMQQQTQNETPDFSNIQLLVAEDVEINREILLTLLADTQVKIDIATNGREAVETFCANPEKYQMIIMDVQMPEMDGYQATRAIRGSDAPNAKTIPIVAMTANVFKEDIDHCLESGMNDHLPKPIDAKAIIAKIQHYTSADC